MRLIPLYMDERLIRRSHGMAETSNDRIIYLDDLLGEEGFSAIEHHDGQSSRLL